MKCELYADKVMQAGYHLGLGELTLFIQGSILNEVEMCSARPVRVIVVQAKNDSPVLNRDVTYMEIDPPSLEITGESQIFVILHDVGFNHVVSLFSFFVQKGIHSKSRMNAYSLLVCAS